MPEGRRPARVTRRTVLTAAVTALGVTACTDDNDDQRPDRPAGELVVGLNLELSGPTSTVGQQQERAARITVEQLNATGVTVAGRRHTVRLVVRDNGGVPARAAQLARELVTRDGAHALIGGSSAETSLASVPVAQELQVPMMSLANADSIALPVARRTYVYKVTPDSADIATALAQAIRRRRQRRVAIVAIPGPYGDSGARAMQEACDAARLTVVRTIRPAGTTPELVTAAQRLVAVAPDAVVVWATAPSSAAVARAMRDADFAGRFYFDPGAVAEETLTGENAAAVEGAYAVHPAILDTSALTNTTSADLNRRAFVLRYVQVHGRFAGFAPYASDALALVVAATRTAGAVNRGRIRAALETTTLDGIAGSYAFTAINHGGMASTSLALFTVTRGAWSRVS